MILVLLTCCAITLTPIIIVLLNWASTSVFVNDFQLPMRVVQVKFRSRLFPIYILSIFAYHFSMPFNTRSSPGYELAYMLSIVNLYSLGFLQLATDSFFLGTCMHVSQSFKNLQTELKRIDNRTSSQNAIINRNLIELYKLYCRVIR